MGWELPWLAGKHEKKPQKYGKYFVYSGNKYLRLGLEGLCFRKHNLCDINLAIKIVTDVIDMTDDAPQMMDNCNDDILGLGPMSKDRVGMDMTDIA